MVDYDFATDIKFIRSALGMNQDQFARKLGVSYVTISNYETGKSVPRLAVIERLYRLAEDNHVHLNVLKTRFLEDDAHGKKLLFHGSRNGIDGPIDLSKGSANSDFGVGLYVGETLRQAATWVSEFDKGSVYCFLFDSAGLDRVDFDVDRDWMLAVCHFRGYLPGKDSHPILSELLARVERADYIVAPIAYNVMYETLREFSEGLLTDEQCIHAISANHLGYQYVFKSERAVKALTAKQRLFLSEAERHAYEAVKQEERSNGIAKLRIARVEYQNKGKYIDAIFA